jgi:acyl-CoA dehydrogenase
MSREPEARRADPPLDFDGLRPPASWFTPAHRAWRDQVRAFVEAHVAPHVAAWDAAGTFPDELYRIAAREGMLGLGFPEALGGHRPDADPGFRILAAEELHRLGTGVVFTDLATHWIALPPVVSLGSAALHDEVVRPVLAGERRIAFAVTEPAGGSDASALNARAERRGDDWVLNGSKTLISGAMRADYLLTAVRTGSAGAGGISLLLVDAAAPGVTRTPVPGLGWYSASNGAIEFRDVVVPGDRLVGVENRGFASLVPQFNVERLSGVAATLAMSRVCLAEAIAYCRVRQTFGQRLIDHQAVRHRLVDLVRLTHAAYAWLDQCVWRIQSGEMPVADIAMLKVQATRTLERTARDSMHLLGGAAFTGGSRIERAYREARIFALGGGTEEILDDLAARQMKF